MFHIGVADAEQEGFMAGALRGDGFRLGGLGLQGDHHKQGEQQLQGEDGIDGERHGMGGLGVCSASVVSLMRTSLN